MEQFLPVIVTILLAAAGYLIQWGTFRAKLESVQLSAATAKVEVEMVRAALADFKVVVAREFVTHVALERMEERIMGGLERLSTRVDLAIDGHEARRRERERSQHG